MKIVINDCYGGFGLSSAAIKLYAANVGIKLKKENDPWGVSYYSEDDRYWNPRNIERNDPELVKVVELLGEDSADSFAALKVIEIPDDVDWDIHEYDGREWVAEKHRTWS
jgi:hypothetical protein